MRHPYWLFIAGTLGLVPAWAFADCANPAFGWSATRPPVNVRHVFCGEFNTKGRPTGAHSMAMINTSAIVLGVTNPRNPRNGLFDATVIFNDNGRQAPKLSTFYPDACSPGQIVNSIAYAASHQTGPAQPWGVLGPSAPKAGDKAYCLGSNGQPFTIRMGLIDGDSRVNTAFPQ